MTDQQTTDRARPGLQVDTPELDLTPAYNRDTVEHHWAVAARFVWQPGDDIYDLTFEKVTRVDGPACQYCAQPYTPAAAARRCPGRPRD